MADAEEEKLIEAVIKARAAGATTNAEVHAALSAEGMDVPMATVKKAASKATKRVGTPAAASAAPAPAAAPLDAPVSAKAAKKAEQAKKAAAAELKAAENGMMEAQRKLRTAKAGGVAGQAVHIDGTMEQFIQAITTRAISGILEDGDVKVLKERMDADIQALEWVKLANAQGALAYTEDVIALGGELQLTRLKEVREAKWDFATAMACYRPPEAAGQDGHASVDRMVKAQTAQEEGSRLEADEQD